MKATQGTYYVNPYLAGDYAGARNARLLNTNPDVAGGGPFPPVLDLEDVSGQPFCYGLSTSGMVDWISQFGNELQRRFGRSSIAVPNGGTSAQGRVRSWANPLWVASYGTPNPMLPSGWSSWTFWHWTSTESVPGITGNVDISYFAGNTSQLAAFSAHAYAQVSTANGRLADFKGDGIKDVVDFQHGSDASVFVSLSTGSSPNPPTRWNPWGPFWYAGSIPVVCHFTRTRIAGSSVVDDIACVQQSSGRRVLRVNVDRIVVHSAYEVEQLGFVLLCGSDPVAGDFDRDGRDDLACDLQSTDGSVLIARSAGSSFSLPSHWDSWGAFCNTGSTPPAGDFNGDGRDDLACDQQSSDGAIFVTTSTGSTLNPPSRWNPGFPFCYTGMTRGRRNSRARRVERG